MFTLGARRRPLLAKHPQRRRNGKEKERTEERSVDLLPYSPLSSRVSRERKNPQTGDSSRPNRRRSLSFHPLCNNIIGLGGVTCSNASSGLFGQSVRPLLTTTSRVRKFTINNSRTIRRTQKTERPMHFNLFLYHREGSLDVDYTSVSIHLHVNVWSES